MSYMVTAGRESDVSVTFDLIKLQNGLLAYNFNRHQLTTFNFKLYFTSKGYNDHDCLFCSEVHFEAQHSFTLSHLYLSLSHRQFLPPSHPIHVQGQQELSVQPEHLQSEPHLQLAEVRRRVKCLANDTLITTNLLHFLQVVRSQQPLPSVHLAVVSTATRGPIAPTTDTRTAVPGACVTTFAAWTTGTGIW